MYIQSCLLQEMNDAKKKEKRRLRSKSAPPKLGQPKHTCKRKQWTEESMIAVMEAVKSGISVSKAALEHNVPRTTFQDRHLGSVEHGNKPGPRSYLSKKEDKVLFDFIEVVISSVGYGRTKCHEYC